MPDRQVYGMKSVVATEADVLDPRVTRGQGRATILLGLAMVTAGLAGCKSTDYTDLAAYYERAPRSILILPVNNVTTDAEAQRFFLATIVKPLVERGYYVFPVEATADILAQEGLHEAGQVWEVEPHQFLRHLGADAVLYTTIEQWDSSHFVLASNVTVAVFYELVDCHSGEVLWAYKAQETVSSNAGYYYGGSGLGVLIGAAVSAAMTAALTDYVPLASKANYKALATLPSGTYHPKYAEVQEKIRVWQEGEEKERQAAEDAEGEKDLNIEYRAPNVES